METGRISGRCWTRTARCLYLVPAMPAHRDNHLMSAADLLGLLSSAVLGVATRDIVPERPALAARHARCSFSLRRSCLRGSIKTRAAAFSWPRCTTVQQHRHDSLCRDRSGVGAVVQVFHLDARRARPAHVGGAEFEA